LTEEPRDKDFLLSFGKAVAPEMEEETVYLLTWESGMQVVEPDPVLNIEREMAPAKMPHVISYAKAIHDGMAMLWLEAGAEPLVENIVKLEADGFTNRLEQARDLLYDELRRIAAYSPK
jgi:hypothetical protein